ncbi:GNAT family N-acetyltransferase [Nocardiopsis composta]|uniref:RimJ/RimL family protein N-acetyltransferase n=1 Tax=Nocardiopsis composta TaxID=157465 RepID=A0A7W8QIL3_9ACTN|nr:GNAT family N-acetyltransferase [Nocardiopsis composta]MBB5430664.1 RimJ/RimL family protein N-acetyltransferase [Nocardiopsis composta]
MADFPPPPLAVPRLRGGGLVLRPWGEGDGAVLRAAAADPRIVRITRVPARYTDRAAREFAAHQARLAELGVGFPFAIEERGGAAGSIGLWRDRADDGRASLGYWVAPPHRGRGLAARALSLLAGWGLEELGLARLEVHVEPGNTASLRTAERAGFVYEGVLRGYLEIAGERRDLAVLSRLPDR